MKVSVIISVKDGKKALEGKLTCENCGKALDTVCSFLSCTEELLAEDMILCNNDEHFCIKHDVVLDIQED